MARASRAGAVLGGLARRAQALIASDAGLLAALIMLFVVSALMGLWVGITLLGWSDEESRAAPRPWS